MHHHPSSPLPDFYYFCFAAYEPFLTILGFVGTLADPLTTHNAQAPWPKHQLPYGILPTATHVTMLQLAHVCALLGLVNLFVLSAIRKHLRDRPALQEKILTSLLTPLLFGDIFHLVVTLWALGDNVWAVARWTPMIWTTVILGLTLLVPRVSWHLGIGRYVDARDSHFLKASRSPATQTSMKH